MTKVKGSPKTGGRKAGTPNKNTATIKAAVTSAVADYLAGEGKGIRLQSDLLLMTPIERARLMAQLAAFVLPKQQQMTISEQQEMERAALADWIKTAPAEAIKGITEKIMQLKAI